jgi:hypothetical protein
MLEKLYRPKEVRVLDGIGNTTFWARVKAGEYETVGSGHAIRVTESSIKRRRERYAKPVKGASA